MKFLPLVSAALWRNPTRTTLTLLSIATAFLIVGVMSGVNTQFNQQIKAVPLDRILVASRFGNSLPISYVNQIEQVPGVAVACPMDGQGGTYQSPTNGLGILMTDDCILKTNPEFAITPQQFQELKRTRNGVIISKKTSDRFNWEVGKTYPLQTQIPARGGTKTWFFKVVMIAPDNGTFYGGYAIGNYAYLDEGRADGLQGQVTGGSIVVRVKDAPQTAKIADSIEKLFVNSGAPVNAAPARARLINQLQAFLNIKLDAYAITGAALFMVVFLTTTVMTQSANERISEFATMKAIGMNDRMIFMLILGEAAAPYVIGAAIGLSLSEAAPLVTGKIIGGNAQVIGLGFLTPLITPAVVVWSFGLAVVVAVLSALPAAWRLISLTVSEASMVH